MMVAGKEVAVEKFGQVIGELTHQIEHGKVIVTELLSKASDMVTKYEPPSFLKPKGDETAKYSYDREKECRYRLPEKFHLRQKSFLLQ